MPPKRILIIEDEKHIARFLELELRHEGYTVQIENEGRNGLTAVELREPDIVLLDIMLPGINGMEVCITVGRYWA